MTSAAGAISIKTSVQQSKPESQVSVVFRRFLRHRMAVVSVVLLALIFVTTLLAPVLTTFDRDAVDITMPERPAAPGVKNLEGQTHWLGIDHLGRDLYTRVLYAGRISLTIAIAVTLFAETIGVVIGAIAGYYGGWVDAFISRLIEFMIALPLLPILLIVSAILLRNEEIFQLPSFLSKTVSAILLVPERESRQVVVLVVILIVFGWLGSARLMRGMVLSLRSQDFVESLRALGASDSRIIFGHLLANGLAPILVNASLNLGGVIVTESALSFLGLGIQDPTPTWGNMLSQSQNYMFNHPWLPLIPGIPLVLASLAVNFIGDGLRDALDPRLKR